MTYTPKGEFTIEEDHSPTICPNLVAPEVPKHPLLIDQTLIITWGSGETRILDLRTGELTKKEAIHATILS